MKHISTNPHIKKEKSYSQFSTPNPKSGGKKQHVRRQPPLRIRRFTFIHLSFLRRSELDLELISEGVQSPLCLHSEMQKVNVNLRNGGEVKSRVEFGGKVVGTHVLTHIMCIQQKHLKTNEIHHIYFTRKIRMCACAKREEKDQYKFPAKESDDLLRRKIG